WWVNQGGDFERERAHGYITAPLRDKAGGEPYHWKVLPELAVGDVVLHYYRQKIAAASEVSASAVSGTRPPDVPDTGWGEDAHFVRLAYQDLEPPIPLSDIPETWRR